MEKSVSCFLLVALVATTVAVPEPVRVIVGSDSGAPVVELVVEEDPVRLPLDARLLSNTGLLLRVDVTLNDTMTL